MNHSQIQFQVFNDINQNVHLHKIILAFLELHRRGGKEKLLETLKMENPSSFNVDRLGMPLYVAFRQGSLFYASGEVSILSSGTNSLVQYGLKKDLETEYDVDCPEYPPQFFDLQSDLLKLEGLLNVRLNFYSFGKSSRKIFKLRNEMSRDSFNYFGSSKKFTVPQQYDIVFRLQENSNKVKQLAFLVCLENEGIGYAPLYQELHLMGRSRYKRVHLIYNFSEQAACCLTTFHEFLLTILNFCEISSDLKKLFKEKNPREVKTVFKNACQEVEGRHSCSKSAEQCNSITGLEFLYGDFFAGFPFSISLTGFFGEKWIYSTQEVKCSQIRSTSRNYLDPLRSEQKKSRLKFDQFMRYCYV